MTFFLSHLCKHVIRVQREKKLMKQNSPRRNARMRIAWSSMTEHRWSSDWNIRAKYGKAEEREFVWDS